jgi:hypothetical protein
LANVNGQLGRIGTGNQIGGTQQIKKFLFPHPFAAHYHLIVHHGDVGGWATESGETQFQE